MYEILYRSLYKIRSKNRKNCVYILLSMNIQVDRLAKVKGKDTHNGLSVDNISAGYEVKINIEFGDIVYKGLNLID